MPELTIKPLVHLPACIDRVVDWHYAQWNHLHPGESRAAARARILATEAGDGVATLPVLFVGVDEAGAPVGTAGLIENDLSSRPDLRPWLASVYTDAFRRGEGIGSALVRHVEEYAFARGFDHIYLYTPDAVPFYETLGWHVYDRGDTAGHKVTIMRKDFAPKRRPEASPLRDPVEEKRRRQKESAERELAAVAAGEVGAAGAAGAGRDQERGVIGLSEDPFASEGGPGSASRAASRATSPRAVPSASPSTGRRVLAVLLCLLLVPASMLLFRNCHGLFPEDRGAIDFGGPADPGTIAMRNAAGGARPGQVFADARLESVVRRRLSIPEGAALPPGLLVGLDSLDASNQGIEDLEGIGLLSNLDSIDLAGNEIGTLRPLLGLKKLTRVDVRGNPFHCPAQRRNLGKLRGGGAEVFSDCGE